MKSGDYVKLNSSPQVSCATIWRNCSCCAFAAQPTYRALGRGRAWLTSGALSLLSWSQVIIQLRKFAQAANRIKAAVGTEASAPQLAKAVSKGEIKPGDLSDILGTEIRDGMDTSAFGKLCSSAE